MNTLRRHPIPVVLGAIFVADAIVYWFAQAYLGAPKADMTGVVALFALGIAMAVVMIVLLSGNEPEA